MVKPKFAWSDGKERSVFEIVSESGVMSPKYIFYIIQNLCSILDSQNSVELPQAKGCIRPQNIIVKSNGTVYLLAEEIPLSMRKPYLPPEQDILDEVIPTTNVYSLGIVMLFMATGNENKTGLDTLIKNKTLRTAIERCTAFDPIMRFTNVKELSIFIKHARRDIKKWLLGFIIILCTCLAVGIIFRFYQQGKSNGESAGKETGYVTGYAHGYEKGFSDAPGIGIGDSPFDPTIGNLPGNISADSGAFAARSEDEIFFIYNESIYKMNPYTKGTQILVKDAEAQNLNYYQGWLYYCTAEQVLRIDPHSMKEEVFCDSRSGILYIADGEFYLDDTADEGYLYKINPADGTLKQLNGVTEYGCLNIEDRRIYYADAEKDYNLYSCDLDGGNVTLMNSNHCEWFCVYDNKIYCYAASYEDYASTILNPKASFLMSMDLNGGSIQRFMNTPAYYVNVTEGGVFYVAGKNKTLEWMSLDGSVRYTVLSSHTGPFNIVGRWIFYQNAEDGGNIWRARIDGSANERIEL